MRNKKMPLLLAQCKRYFNTDDLYQVLKIDKKANEKEGSETERTDLKKAYLEGQGNMDYIVDHVQFARAEHEPRLVDLITKMIADGEVPAYKIFTHEPEKKKKRRHAKEKREAQEVEEIERQEKESGSDLALMIQQKQRARAQGLDSFIDGLAAKYGGAERTAKRKTKPAATTAAAAAKRRKTKK